MTTTTTPYTYESIESIYNKLVALANENWQLALQEGHKYLLPRPHRLADNRSKQLEVRANHNHGVYQLMEKIINENAGNSSSILYNVAYQKSHSSGWLAVYHTLCDFLDEIDNGLDVEDLLDREGY